LLLIGPEGGFTDSEEKEAIAKGFVPVSLGKKYFTDGNCRAGRAGNAGVLFHIVRITHVNVR